MPQLKTNTVTVTNGSNSVVGSGTTWLTGPNPVTVGAYLIISDENGGSPTVYEVQTIPSDTSLTLTTNWAGVTGTYNAVIHIDFLPNGVPQLTSGDLETVAVINRAHKILGDGDGVAAATTTTRGTVEKATEAEAIAGTADDKFPDVKGVKAFLYDRMVGTTSESGGSPTGDIIERGSNANGKYTRFADGTLYCWRTFAPNQPADKTWVSTAWNFPATFSATPEVSVSLGIPTSNQIIGCAGGAVDGSSGTVYLNCETGPLVGQEVTALAKGRWY